MHRPSIRNGFAPRDGMARWPSLWRGCIGAWASGLGPQGVTLRDWSPYRASATLSNMDMTSDWVADNGRYALDFDGVNDIAGVSGWTLFDGLPAISCCAWIYATGYGGGGFGRIVSRADTVLMFAHSTNQWAVTINGTSTNALGSSILNQWIHVGFTYRSGLCTLFRNGVEVTTGAPTGAVSTGSGLHIGGRASASDRNFAGRIDDVRCYNRLLHPWEMRLLARRRCIAYELDDDALGYYSAPSGGAARLRRILAGLP